MRLGPLILQICAVIVACAIIFGGYVWYRHYEVASYVERYSLEDFGAYVYWAPTMKCYSETIRFGSSQRTSLYFYNGWLRQTTQYPATKKTLHVIHDSYGYYAWMDHLPEIHYFLEESSSGAASGGTQAAQDNDIELDDIELEPLMSSYSCSVWWRPDGKLFQLPASMPVIYPDNR